MFEDSLFVIYKMASSQQNLPCLYCRTSFRKLNTFIRHLKNHVGSDWISCSILCGAKKKYQYRKEFAAEHKFKDLEWLKWKVTKESLQKTLEAGVALPGPLFQHHWDAAGVVLVEEPVGEQGQVEAAISNRPRASRSQEPAHDSSSDEEAHKMPLGWALPMFSDSADWRERFH